MCDAKYIKVSRSSLDEAIEVLALAFENDPFLQYVLSHHGVSYLRQVREFFRFNCEIGQELEHPFIGTMHDAQLTGVASISIPEKKDWPNSLVEKHEKLESAIGIKSARRLERSSILSAKYAPSQPHHYLSVIGIHPKFQGRGLSRLLLDATHKMSESHPKSTGVCLDTTNSVNIPFYEHFGYHMVSKDKLDDTVDIWFMFRPNNIKI